MKFRKFMPVLILVFMLAACGSDATLPVTPTVSSQTTTDTTTTNPRTTVATIASTSVAISAASTTTAGTVPANNVTPASNHPRLWVKGSDLPRLRSWAVDSNPVYKSGILVLANRAKAEMDNGTVPKGDEGTNTYVDYPTETYAELFAFMSLISNDQATRDDYAKRARTLLMFVINQAEQGVAEGKPFRDQEFSTNDRSRWHGEAFSLTVDWIYSYLTPKDKESILKVFLRWSEENLNAQITGHDHPEPIGKVNDPELVKDTREIRWSANNYWTAHMRNLGQMAMALDPGDDPDNKLGAYLANATGAWLYVFDHFLRNEGKGGMLPEGFEYSPQTTAYAIQFLLALHTAGQDNPAKWGPQVSLNGNPFWSDFVQGYLHSLGSNTVMNPDLGPVYQPAWYGDGLKYWSPDFIQAFAPLALYYGVTGNKAAQADLRWIQTNLAPGGADYLLKRITNTTFYQDAILYFMLFDPSAPAPADPRPKLKLSFFAPGMGRVLSRTSWDKNASWFTYKLSWNSVDHQNGDGNQFEFYRKGEWLTKERSGYDLDYGSSDNHNTLTLQNTAPEHNEAGAFRNVNWLLGSQWAHVSNGNPQLVAYSPAPNYEYVLGDATPLYNSESEGPVSILHASRSILWIKPDYIFVYDRAESKNSGTFKRFWLNLPAVASVTGNQTSMTTASGQKLFITTLLPSNASVTIEAASTPPQAGDVAEMDSITHKLKVEAPGGPTSVRFLNVLQGADAGANADNVTLIQSSGGTSYAGAVVKNVAALFPVDITTSFVTVIYTVPASVTEQYVTGLKPNTGYNVAIQKKGNDSQVTITLGGPSQTDVGGVLVLK